MVDNICGYDEGYSINDAAEIGFCSSCTNRKCRQNPDYKTGKDFVKAIINEYEKLMNRS